MPPSLWPIVILQKQDILESWKWLIKLMSPRPNRDSGLCVYDQKMWGKNTRCEPLSTEVSFVQNLASLYLTSQLADIGTILEIARNGKAQDIVVYDTCLDGDVKAVIESEDRFRDALSEHLAFWTRLATEVKGKYSAEFSISMPNFQPEDKGPDGLFLSIGSPDRVEVYSVKNTIRNPQPLVSSTQFRKNKKPKRYKQLDDFWLNANNGLGIGRLDRLLDQVFRALNVSPKKKIRIGLLSQCAYNAVVVADHKYSSVDLFEGYQHINRDVEKRIATYIGATDWQQVAMLTRKHVKQLLRQAGVK